MALIINEFTLSLFNRIHINNGAGIPEFNVSNFNQSIDLFFNLELQELFVVWEPSNIFREIQFQAINLLGLWKCILFRSRGIILVDALLQLEIFRKYTVKWTFKVHINTYLSVIQW